jgi:hypothetical protein
MQLEHEALLRCLVRRHGLKRVLSEGLTAEGLPAYHDVLGALRATGEWLEGLRKEIAGLRGKHADAERQLAELLAGHRWELLE